MNKDQPTRVVSQRLFIADKLTASDSVLGREALKTLTHAALADGSLGIISGMLSAELLHSSYSVRVEIEYRILDNVGNELLGILVDGNNGSMDITGSK